LSILIQQVFSRYSPPLVPDAMDMTINEAAPFSGRQEERE
jgi:hypothetical protein